MALIKKNGSGMDYLGQVSLGGGATSGVLTHNKGKTYTAYIVACDFVSGVGGGMPFHTGIMDAGVTAHTVNNLTIYKNSGLSTTYKVWGV